MLRRTILPLLAIAALAGCRAPTQDAADTPAPSSAIEIKERVSPLPRPEEVHAIAFFGDNVESEDLPLEFVERDPARIAELLDAVDIHRHISREDIPDSGPLGYQAFLDAEGRLLGVAVPWLDSAWRDSGCAVAYCHSGWTFDGSTLRLEERIGSDLRDRLPFRSCPRMYIGLVYDAMRRHDSASLRQMDDEFKRLGGVEGVLGLDPESRERDRKTSEAISRLRNIVIPSIAFTNATIPEVFAALEKAATEVEITDSRKGRPPIRFVYQSQWKEADSEEDTSCTTITFCAEAVPLKDVLDIMEIACLIDVFPAPDGTFGWRHRGVFCGQVLSGTMFVRGPYHELPKKIQLRRFMETTRIDALSLHDEPLDKALAALAAALGTNAPTMEAWFTADDEQTVRFSATEHPDAPLRLPRVTLDVHDRTLREVLDDIAGQAGMEAVTTVYGVAISSSEGDGQDSSLKSVPDQWESHAEKILRSICIEGGGYRNAPLSVFLGNIRDEIASSEATAPLQIRVDESIWRKTAKEGYTFHFRHVPAWDLLDILANCQDRRLSVIGNIVWLGTRRTAYECIEAGNGSPEASAFREALDDVSLPEFSARWAPLRDVLRDIGRRLGETDGKMPERWRGLRFEVDGTVPEASGAAPVETLPDDVIALRDGRLWLQLDRVSLRELLDVIGNVARLRFNMPRDGQEPVVVVGAWVP